jgi:hypothetical protein
MKAATVSELKKDLKQCTQEELLEICLSLSKFKKENKELLTYLLYESSDEEQYIENVKEETEFLFSEINTSSYYLMKKTVRKIQRNVKKYIRYSKKKETEVELLIHFCSQMRKLRPAISRNQTLENIFLRQKAAIEKTVSSLHEDLQYDYLRELEEL